MKIYQVKTIYGKPITHVVAESLGDVEKLISLHLGESITEVRLQSDHALVQDNVGDEAIAICKELIAWYKELGATEAVHFELLNVIDKAQAVVNGL